MTFHAGLLTIDAVQPNASSPESLDTDASHHMTIEPGETSQPVVPLIGPRTIRADDEEETMAVVIPADFYGNVVADGTAVDLTVTRNVIPNSTERFTANVRNLLAWSWIDSETVTGTASVAASAEGVDGRVIEFLEVPLPPVSIKLLEPRTSMVSNGRTLHEVRTAPLVDRFGNEVQDGVATSFFVRDDAGFRHLPGLVIDGVGRVVVEASSKPGTIEIWAVIQGVRSSTLELDVSPAVDTIPYRIEQGESAEGPMLHVGPVSLSAGGLVPDGTWVVVTSADSEIQTEAQLNNGVVVIDLSLIHISEPTRPY